MAARGAITTKGDVAECDRESETKCGTKLEAGGGDEDETSGEVETGDMGHSVEEDSGTSKPLCKRWFGDEGINEGECPGELECNNGIDGTEVETSASTRTIGGGGTKDASFEAEDNPSSDYSGETEGLVQGLNSKPRGRNRGNAEARHDKSNRRGLSPEVLATIGSLSSDEDGDC